MRTHERDLHNLARTCDNKGLLDSRFWKAENDGKTKRIPGLTCPPLFSVRNWYCTLWSENAACETLVMVTAACSSVPTASPATHPHIRNLQQDAAGALHQREAAVSSASRRNVQVQCSTAIDTFASTFPLGFFSHHEGALGCCRLSTSIDISQVQIHTQILVLQANHVPVSGSTHIKRSIFTQVGTNRGKHRLGYYFFKTEYKVIFFLDSGDKSYQCYFCGVGVTF